MAEKRSSFRMLMNTAPDVPATPVYETIGNGVTELSISYNPQTTTEQYIDQDTATTDITGYQPNAPVGAQAVKTDPVFAFINKIRKKLSIMGDAYTDVVLADLYEVATAGSYPATKQNVSIQIDSYGGAATDPLSISYTINWRGDGIEGKFDTATKKFTPTTTP